ncbi:MAG: GNAT family N-acetyltransferase [Lachnospiraceae bacterium]|nr:GNAT family N-acetyltransferase [Lachnospiraceae bacterium]
MITIRSLTKEDLSYIQDIDFMVWLSISYNKAVMKEQAVAAVDEEGTVCGAAAFTRSATWYYLDGEKKPEFGTVTKDCEYKLDVLYGVMEEHPKQEEIQKALFDSLKKKLSELKQVHPGQKLSIRCFAEDNDHDEIDFLLRNGFIVKGMMPVLSYDLTGDIAIPKIPENIRIGLHSFKEDGMDQYLKANAAGFIAQDSEDEMRFRLGGETTAVICAYDKDEVVSSVTVWEIGNGRSATENIFTVPDYQRKGIGTAVVLSALKLLKDRGEREATLSVVGDNKNAIAFYEGLGYHYKYGLLEMCFE